jgi:hypothetical protein
MLYNFYIPALAGFLAMGIFRYVVRPGWDLKTFLASQPRVVLKCLIFASVSVYFAHDLAALLPKELMGVRFDAAATIDRAPKFSGFVLGFMMSSPDAGKFLLNIVGLIPVVGPQLVNVFTPKA